MSEIFKYHAFLSHAFEDKDFTDLLANRLNEYGLNIWYSGHNLVIGDSISDAVNKGLKESAYGIIVLSPTYLKKAWAMAEFKALFALEIGAGKKRILPIYHKTSNEEVLSEIPTVADRFAISTEKGLDHICQSISQAIEYKIPVDIKDRVDKGTHIRDKIPSTLKLSLEVGKTIRRKIGNDQLKEAIDDLYQEMERKGFEKELDELYLKKQNYHRAYLNNRKGIVKPDDYQFIMTRIASDILDMVYDLSES